MAKKKEKEEKVEEVKKYSVKDVYDRDFRTNGIELQLKAGVAVEVDEATAKKLKAFPYLEVKEV
jgi:hypothetical protein